MESKNPLIDRLLIPSKSDESGPKPSALNPVSFLKLFRYSKGQERCLLFTGAFLVSLSGLALIANIGFALFMLKDVTEVYSGIKTYEQIRGSLVSSAIKVFNWSLCMSAMTYLGISVFMYVGEKIIYRMRKRFMKSVLHMDMAWFDSLGAGEITTRITSDIDRVREGVGEKVALLIMDTGIMVASIGISFFTSPILSFYVCSLIILSFIASIVGNIFAQRFISQALGQYAQAGSLAEEVLASIRTIHSFNMFMKITQLYETYISSSEKLSQTRIYIEGVTIGMLTFSVYLGLAIDIKVGFGLVYDSKIEGYEILVVFLALFFGMYSVSSIPPNLLAITSARAAAAKIYQVIELAPLIHTETGSRLDSVLGDISFKGIDFHYPSRPDVPIFENFSLEIASGTTVALVGASGSGKSTLVQLLERFYDPIDGQVLLDNINIKEFNVKWYRRQIGLVSQEPVLFSGTIFDNVALGLIGTTLENSPAEDKRQIVEDACRNANAHDFITQLTNGYETDVGEQGFLLSGGQKQRIAIARAIAKDPKILLLDEATSALDTKSERVVQEALDRASKGRTTIAIAHRLSTIKNADRIVVMDRGSIVEQGSHSELMALAGTYCNLVKIQNTCPAYKAVAPSKLIAQVDECLPSFSASVDLEDAQESEASLFRSVFEIMKLNLPEVVWNFGGVMGAIFLGLMNFILGISLYLSFKPIFDKVMKGGLKVFDMQQELWSVFFSVLGVAILSCISQIGCVIGFGVGAEKLSRRLRMIIMSSLLKQEVGWFDLESNSTGVLVSAASLIPQRITFFSGTSLGAFVNVFTNIVASSAIGFFLNAKITIVLTIFLPILLGLGLLSIYLMDLFSNKCKQANMESTKLACENAAQMRTVASLTKESLVFEHFKSSIKLALKTGCMNAFYSTILIAISGSVVPLVLSLALIFAASLEVSQNIPSNLQNLGIIMFIIIIFVLVTTDATRKMPLITSIKYFKDGAKSFYQISERQPIIDFSKDGPGKFVDAAVGAIQFSDVQFRYPTRPNVPSLRGISFQVNPGQLVAFVGPSGCGKSTSIGLIERFYDVTRGSITLDGVDIRDLHLPSYRDHISLVGQEPALFNLSVKDNILMGARTYGAAPTMDDVIFAAKSSNIHDFVMSLPDGYETMVGGKGTQLSGGQKQRIAIARALIRNPKILLLDEATSALDAGSERIVQTALDSASKGRTTLAIAHRLATIRNADMILVMKDGLIIERGTHQELMAINGLYTEMANQQNLA